MELYIYQHRDTGELQIYGAPPQEGTVPAHWIYIGIGQITVQRFNPPPPLNG